MLSLNETNTKIDCATFVVQGYRDRTMDKKNRTHSSRVTGIGQWTQEKSNTVVEGYRDKTIEPEKIEPSRTGR